MFLHVRLPTKQNGAQATHPQSTRLREPKIGGSARNSLGEANGNPILYRGARVRRAVRMLRAEAHKMFGMILPCAPVCRENAALNQPALASLVDRWDPAMPFELRIQESAKRALMLL